MTLGPEPDEPPAHGSTKTASLELQPRDVYSQCGEDGILHDLFLRLGIQSGYCVEFGAWDGIQMSNTYNLIVNHGWRGLVIEADQHLFELLRSNMAPHPDVTCLRAAFGFDGAEQLDSILRGASAPEEFELLSIDIDGNDYHVWDVMRSYRPKVVVVEFNPTIPNHVAFVQPRDTRIKQGSSVLALARLGARKGYRPVAATLVNVVFVRADLADDAGIPVLPLDLIRTNHAWETNILQLLDGTIKVVGPTRGIWNGIEMRFVGVQSVPRFLRVYPPDAARWQRPWLRLLERESRFRARARTRLKMRNRR